jgi:CHAT domain-containing protein/tetratricopeptide (TPR) repeat protein
VGQYDTALGFLEQALSIARAVGDRRQDGVVLVGLGRVYQGLQQYDTALGFLEQALAAQRAVGDRREEGWALNALGNVYVAMSQNDKAVPFYEQALDIARAVGNRRGELVALANLGIRYSDWSQYDKAVPFLEQALSIAREIGDQQGEGRSLCALGNLYTTLQQYDTALVFLEQALVVQRAMGDQRGQGWTLNELGRVYTEVSQYEKALVFLEQALSLTRTVGDRRQEGWAWLNLGRVYQTLQQYAKALPADEQALAIAREVGNRLGEGTALAYLGRVYQGLGQYDQALTVDAQALLIMREVGHRAGEGTIYGQLMAVWNAQHQPRLAIFYGKRAVNVFQAIRGTLQPLAPALQEGFLTSKTSVYRELAEVLITEGRLLEAQQVLDLLKIEEYLDFVHRDATATALAGQATLTPEEAEWAQRYAAIADRVAALGAERGALRARPTRTAAEGERLAQLEADLMAANWAFQRFLAELQTELNRTPLAQEKVFALRETQGLMADLRELGPGTVALYTLVGPTTSRVLLITPDVQLAREVPITAADLSRKVVAFREALAAVRYQVAPPDPRPLAHELYELFIGPVAADLRAVQAQTMLWSLDGVLRYLPLAALYDGEHYLLERYALVVFTPASQARLKDAPQPQWQALGLGVSKAHADLPALPGVIRELQDIIRDPTFNATAGVLPGIIKLDEAFTASSLLAALRQGYPVVHIASHFQLRPGDEAASFLLLGDGRHLSLTQVKTWPAVLSGVDLLTLSACNTAIGGMGADGKEVEGFAVLAQRQGAKAVLATLWPVEDRSTHEVMQTFYRLRVTQPGLSKAAALRQAQLRLLAGQGPHDVVPGPAPMLSSGGPSPEARQDRGIDLVHGPAATRPSGELPRPASYAHPYFWAPFILIGNWQ